MNANAYMVATVSGVSILPVSAIHKTKKGAINAYKKAYEETGDKNLRILKAQWVNADFDEYIQLKMIYESGESDEL